MYINTFKILQKRQYTKKNVHYLSLFMMIIVSRSSENARIAETIRPCD